MNSSAPEPNPVTGVLDIFEAQSRARRRSVFLIALWLTLTGVMVVVAYGFVWFFAAGWPFETPLPGLDAPIWDPALAVLVAIPVIGAVVGGSCFQYFRLRKGGVMMARLIGGRLVGDPGEPGHEKEAHLANVTEEMAIAAGLPVPSLLVLRAEPGINAFAAGLTPDDAAVAVTAGALERLDRDELQALVAHELAHIAQGDVRVRTLSLALIHGFLFVSLAGAALLGGSILHRTARPGLSFLLGLALTVAGAMGAGLARVLQAAVGREREFLADARAAQYTRAPRALASAIRKAGGSPDASEVRHHYRKEYRHTFFTAEAALGPPGPLATHPPLDARIRRLHPHWDGTYTHTSLSEGSTTAVIAQALEEGRQTSIPEDEEWSIAAHSGEDRPIRNPDHWVSEAFGNAARRISLARKSTTPSFEHRKRAPKVRLPSRSAHEPDQNAPPLPPVPAAERIHSFAPVRTEARTILAALAERAGGGPEVVEHSLGKALSALPTLGEVSHPGPVSNAAVVEAIASLSRLSPGALHRLLEVCAFAVDREGTTTLEAAALLRSCSRQLGVDLPEVFGNG